MPRTRLSPNPSPNPSPNHPAPRHSAVVPIEGRLDLRSTLRPLSRPGDPTGATRTDGRWKAVRTPEGPATVRVWVPQASEPDETVRRVGIAGWGPGSEWAVAAAHDWLGPTDRPQDFDPSPHPVVERMVRQHAGLRLGRFGMIAERMVLTILEQKVIASEAKRSYRRLLYRYSEPAPGPIKLLLPMAPDALVRLPMHDWHRLGVEQKRARTVRNTMKYASRLDQLMDREPAEAYEFMHKLPGIGPWTSATVGAAAFGDPDVVLVGDYNLPHFVSWVLAGERRSDDTRMLELLEPFAGHRARVLRLLKGAGTRPPRRGAHLAYRNVQTH